jgi:hypothetical protein
MALRSFASSKVRLHAHAARSAATARRGLSLQHAHDVLLPPAVQVAGSGARAARNVSQISATPPESPRRRPRLM